MNLDDLKGKLLLATPSMPDPNFKNVAIFICHYDADGCMGLVINRSQPITVDSILNDLNISHEKAVNFPVYAGGPIEPFRGFVLHDHSHHYETTLSISDDIHLSTSRDIIEDIALGALQHRYMLLLGYTGWNAGQLEKELAQNDWIIAPANKDIIFDTPVSERWEKSAIQMGVRREMLCDKIGHA
ncbi:MAG: YqgE/AlgH family protein [Mariprofundaceae bacterium]|nr:YqgE/AlgH family protein [Mariprofundaceae bacterium]